MIEYVPQWCPGPPSSAVAAAHPPRSISASRSAAALSSASVSAHASVTVLSDIPCDQYRIFAGRSSLSSVWWAGCQLHCGGVLLARGIHPGQLHRVSGVMGAEQGGEGGGRIDRRSV